MKVKYRDAKLGPESIARLNIVNLIINEYHAQGLVLTLRQLYYQLVSRDIIPNQPKEYSKLSILLKEGRMCGIVDWDSIEDRLRTADKPSSWNSVSDILDSAISSYAKDRMQGQKTYLEVWVEKDAISGFLSPVTEEYHIPICVNRGYSSASAMHEAFKRMHQAYKADQKIRIIYLGDYDPSGIDMIRDVEHRVLEFFFGYYFRQGKRKRRTYAEDFKEILRDNKGLDFEVLPVALTKKQITQYKPPPNPAKRSDPRSGKFVADHGSKSWEVDALKPEVLIQILRDAIKSNINQKLFKQMVNAEEPERMKLVQIRDKYFK